MCFYLDYVIGFFFILELVLGKIRPSEVFSGAPETLANLLIPTRSISPWELYICSLDRLYPPSVQRTRSCFLPCSSYYFPCFQEGHIPLVFHFKYFFFGRVNITRSGISRMTLLADCLMSYQDTRWGSLTPLQRCSRCILQPQPTGPPILGQGYSGKAWI